jgi:hypothetical protein
MLFCAVLIYALIKRGREWYLLPFVIVYLPIYITLQSLTFQQTGSALAVHLIQYLKEVILFLTFFVFLFYKKDVLAYSFKLRSIDFVFISFIALAALFLILPIGGASFFSKAIYFKNILILALMYFFGRNMVLSERQIKIILGMIISVAVAAFLLNTVEYVTNTHFHSLVGYGKFNDIVHDIEPTGHYGLSWTFETQMAAKRFGAFYANPLELASASLLCFATAFILFMKTPHRNNQIIYFGVIILIISTLLYSYSRASIVAFFLELAFIAVLFKYYKILLSGFILFLASVIYIFYFASDDLYYFVVDTITFQNASSFGHLIEWVEGVESMSQSPQGIGLAMSGNASGVDADLKIGGENQFLIYGVQMGVLGLFLYILLLFLSIRFAIKAYFNAPKAIEGVIPFIAGTTKFALLLPLFTANAELYLFVSYLTWWMVGYSVQTYNKQMSTRLVMTK